ncbi:MAG TPA: Abi-alpha family protein [Edaphobacter sp.]|nr:Abi-alpha family protein [Edaphobacter sp.]
MSNAGEILKSGPFDKAADLLHRLAGPMFDEFGAMLADKVRVYRVKNLISTVKRTERLLKDAGLPANVVPPRLLLPIIENCSVEDNDTLQDMWAGLLATASQETDSASPSFIETLKQLTPDDARHLEVICQDSIQHFNDIRERTKHFGNKFEKKDRICDGMTLAPWAFGGFRFKGPERFDVPPSVYADTYVRLGLIRTTFEVSSSFDRRDLDAYGDEGIHQEVNSEVDGWYEFTEYAVRFLDACNGPEKQAK